jgi:autotransporter-associated beta strand protein
MRGSISWRMVLVLSAVVGLVLALSGSAQAVVILVGDDPTTGNTWELGATYHLAFVTSGTRDATSPDIADYQSFVQTAADAAGLGGVTWQAILQTYNDPDRNTNAPAMNTSVPIFFVDGVTKLADNGADLADGPDVPFMMTEIGTNHNGAVATGSSRKPGDPGQTNIEHGVSWATDGRWWQQYNGAKTAQWRFYAISDPIVFGGDPVYWDLDGNTPGAGSTSGAATGIWNAANTNWNADSTGADGGIIEGWTAGKAAVFAAGTDANGTYTVTVDATQDISGLSFKEGTVKLSGGTALRLVVATTPVIVGSGLTATIETPISEDAPGRALAKYGPGTLILSGANAYTGATTVVDGTLRLDANNVLPDASNVTVSGGTAGGTATLDLNGKSDTIGGLTLGGATATSGAAVTTGAGKLTLGGDVAYNSAQNPMGATISGNLNLGVATRTFTVGDSATATHDLTVSAVISADTGMGLTKEGAGTLVLSGTNTYDGMTSINAGALVFGKQTSINGGIDSFAPANVTVASGAVLGLAVGDSAGLFNSADIDTVLNATHMGSSATGTGMKPGAMIGLDTTNATGGTFTRSDPIGDLAAGGLNSIGLAKLGEGTLVLGGANTYTGGTTLYAGTTVFANTMASGTALTINNAAIAQLGAAGGLPTDTTVAFGPGGTGKFQLNGNDMTVVDLSTNGGTPIVENGSATTNAVLTYNNTAAKTYAGVLQDGDTGKLGLTKTSGGTLTLTGNNTYTGATTISAGILQIGNNTSNTLGIGGTYAGNISIAGGATLNVFSNITQTLSGVISGGGSVVKGYGGTLVLTGDSTYTGKTSITPQTTAGGTLSVDSFNSVETNVTLGTVHSEFGAMGAPTTAANGTIDIGSTGKQAGCTLIYTGTGETTDRILRFNTNNNTGSHTLRTDGTGLLKFTSQFVRAGNGINALGLDGAGDGEIVPAVPFMMGGVIKAGTGTWTLDSSENLYIKTTTINGGVLSVSHIGDGGFDPTLKTTANSAIVTASSTAGLAVGMTVISQTIPAGHTIASIEDATHFTLNSGTGVANSGTTFYTSGVGSPSGLGLTPKAATGLVFSNGTLQYTGPDASTNRSFTIAAGKTATWDIAGIATNLTVSGASTATTGALIKTGAGTLTLTGANTYTGNTTVSNGNLLLGQGGSMMGATAVIVTNTGTFGTFYNSNGNVIAGGKSLSLAAGTTLDMRDANTNTLGFTATGAFSAASLYFDLDASGGDKLVLAGTATVTGNTFYFDALGDGSLITGNHAYKLIEAAGGLATVGGFTIGNTLPEYTLTLDAQDGAVYLTVALSEVPGDTNSDNVVDAADFITLKKNFGAGEVGGKTVGNFDNAGTVDWYDLSILTGNMGTGGPAPSTTPEPATLGLLAIGALAMLRRNRRS